MYSNVVRFTSNFLITQNILNIYMGEKATILNLEKLSIIVKTIFLYDNMQQLVASFSMCV